MVGGERGEIRRHFPGGEHGPWRGGRSRRHDGADLLRHAVGGRKTEPRAVNRRRDFVGGAIEGDGPAGVEALAAAKAVVVVQIDKQAQRPGGRAAPEGAALIVERLVEERVVVVVDERDARGPAGERQFAHARAGTREHKRIRLPVGRRRVVEKRHTIVGGGRLVFRRGPRHAQRHETARRRIAVLAGKQVRPLPFAVVSQVAVLVGVEVEPALGELPGGLLNDDEEERIARAVAQLDRAVAGRAGIDRLLRDGGGALGREPDRVVHRLELAPEFVALGQNLRIYGQLGRDRRADAIGGESAERAEKKRENEFEVHELESLLEA